MVDRRGDGGGRREAPTATGLRRWGRRVVAQLGEAGSLHLVALEVLPEGGGVGVRFVAAPHRAVVRLVCRVHVHVLLPVARVGEPAVTALDLALERFLA